jgi:hypothetical protein
VSNDEAADAQNSGGRICDAAASLRGLGRYGAARVSRSPAPAEDATTPRLW